jgi:hypothetical protein
MSRIYTVTNKKTGKVERYVRANTLNAATGEFHVLDAVAPEQLALGGGL